MERAADGPGAVIHDVKAQPRGFLPLGRGETRAVILDAQLDLVGLGAEPNAHDARPAVFDGVVHGFLGNAVQVRGHGGVLDCDRPLAVRIGTGS